MAARAPLFNLPLYRTGLRRMVRRPLQYLLFVLGVALGVAMMVSIDLANGSARRAFQLSTDAIAGKTTHRIVGPATGLDQALYVDLRRQGRLALAAPIVEGYVRAPALGDQPMRLVGVDPFAEPPFRDYLQPPDQQPPGQQPAGQQDLAGLDAFLTTPNGIVMSQALATQHDLALGDTLTLDLAGEQVDGLVIGLIEPADDVTTRGLQGTLFTDISNAQQLFDMPGRLSRIDLIVDDDANLPQLRDSLPASARLEPATASGNAIQQMVAAFELNLTALSLLALVVGMFLIYNTVTFSVVQRRKLFGILRSLGVTGHQLFALILGEAAGLSLIGSLLGAGLGVLLGRIMIRLVTQTINDFYFVVNVQQVSVPLFSLVKGVFIGLVAALLASLPPALEALRTTPSSSLRRSSLESKSKRLVPWLVPVWAALLLLGALLLWFRGAGLALNFAGLFAVLIGFALLCPPLTLWGMRALAPLLGRLLGSLGRMAPRDIARSLSRTSIAIAALMTAVSVIIGVSIMIGSFRGTVETWLNAILQADIYVSPPALTSNRVTDAVDPAIIERLRAYPGVDRLVTGRTVDVLSPSLGREIALISPDGDVSAGQRPYRWIDGDEATLWQRFEAGQGILISDPLVQRDGLSLPPPPITLVTASGPRTFPVLAVFYDYASDRGAIFIDHRLYVRLWQDETINTAGLFVQPGVDIDRLVTRLQADLAPLQALEIRSNRGLRAASLEIFDRTFAVTAALQLLATVVAFIGVLSALLSLQLERQRELGVLRATGMTLGQMWRLTLLETGIMGALAGLLAMPTGFVLAWILIYVINVRSFGWVLQMDLRPGYFLQAFLVALVAALLAGIYPSLRLGQTVIATAIRQE